MLTHNGRFHADDVFSAALLKILKPDIKIIRKSKVPENYGGLVFDLRNGEYDHHGQNVKVRENGTEYASFGLLWNKYGKLLVGEKYARSFDETFIQPLDIQDNNGGNNLLCRAITQANPKWDEKKDSDACFFKAVDMAVFILENEISAMNSTRRAESIVLDCLKESDGGIVVLPVGMPWKETLAPTDALYVVYPSDRGGYNGQCVPVSADSLECKLPFPKEWRENDGLLPEITGIDGLFFCHRHGYLIAAKDLDSALTACETSIIQQTKAEEKA